MSGTKFHRCTVVHNGEQHEVERRSDGAVFIDGTCIGCVSYIERLTCEAESIEATPYRVRGRFRRPAFVATRRTLEEATTALALWWLGRQR